MDDLDRLFQRLVEVLHERGPEKLSQPIQVAELYQELVPYRTNRTALRVETHEDYEMALLRLLAGERDYARVEPPEVQEALRRELGNPYTRTGAFREFAAAQVYLDPRSVAAVLAREAAYAPPPAPRPASPAASAAIPAAASAEASCPYCGAELPTGREVYYCPFCGGNVRGVQCPECATELEIGWSYCITCGRKMARD